MLGERFPTTLEAARQGADWAWAALYRDLAPAVLGYLRGRQANDPDGLTGEVFLQVARDLASFAGDEGQFRAWVFVLAHHRLLDERRYHRRRPADPSPDGAIHARAPLGNVEDEALAVLESQRIRSLLSSLTDNQAEVLALRILGGFTLEEVARMTGRHLTTVKALQRRGLAALKKKLPADPSPF